MGVIHSELTHDSKVHPTGRRKGIRNGLEGLRYQKDRWTSPAKSKKGEGGFQVRNVKGTKIPLEMELASIGGNPARNSIFDSGRGPLWSKPSPIFSPDWVLAPLPSSLPSHSSIHLTTTFATWRPLEMADGLTIRGVDLAGELESGPKWFPLGCTNDTSCFDVLRGKVVLPRRIVTLHQPLW